MGKSKREKWDVGHMHSELSEITGSLAQLLSEPLL